VNIEKQQVPQAASTNTFYSSKKSTTNTLDSRISPMKAMQSPLKTATKAMIEHH
jgi:hypothetical protein